jgi:hypothetical protein
MRVGALLVSLTVLALGLAATATGGSSAPAAIPGRARLPALRRADSLARSIGPSKFERVVLAWGAGRGPSGQSLRRGVQAAPGPLNAVESGDGRDDLLAGPPERRSSPPCSPS